LIKKAVWVWKKRLERGENFYCPVRGKEGKDVGG